MIKIKLLKKFMKKKFYIKNPAVFFAFIITILLLSVFSFTSCCIQPQLIKSKLKDFFVNDGFFKQIQTPEEEPENGTKKTADDAGQDGPLPPKAINVYIDSLISYKNRNIILKELEKSLEDYEMPADGDNKVSAESGSSFGEENETYKKYSGFIQVYDAGSADLVFKIVSGKQLDLAVAGPFYFAAVTSFYSLVEEISYGDLNQYWRGIKTSFNDLEGNGTEMQLAVSKQVFDIMQNIAGECNAPNLHILSSQDIEAAFKTGIISKPSGGDINSDEKTQNSNDAQGSVEDTEENRQNTEEKNPDNAGSAVLQVMSIVSFDNIKPYHKVLKIDGINLLDKSTKDEEFTSGDGSFSHDSQNSLNYISNYPLVFAIGAEFNNFVIDQGLAVIIKGNIEEAISSNRSEDNLTSVMMTGVTALTRQVAARMDEKDILYPAEKIREVLLDADITHISNEVPFVPDCFAAKPNTTVFCSKPEYIELLKYIDTDVIELTGNHVNDYGSKWLDYTIDIYDREGIPYFGGGRNIEDALKPALFEINGLKIAFLGANPAGPTYAWATETTAGSAPINTLSDELMEKDMLQYEDTIKLLKSRGYIVIFTFQYFEHYNYSPTAQQVVDFERMINAGADIVSGSQAHAPHGVKILDNGFINYGLGNLFFGQQPRDALLALKVKQGIIAKHIFYEGKHINTELITTFIEDASQPRLTTDEERADLLKSVFKGSKGDGSLIYQAQQKKS